MSTTQKKIDKFAKKPRQIGILILSQTIREFHEQFFSIDYSKGREKVRDSEEKKRDREKEREGK